MQHKLAELIDVKKTQKLMENLLGAVGVPAAIHDLEGEVIVATRWQRICTDFHRANPATCKRCIESDTVLANELMQGKSFSLYRCLNGLTDAASPIVIGGEHLANAFIGQFLSEKPDLDFFGRQAQEHGFDKSDYFQALSEVPIVEPDVLPRLLSFLTSFAEMIASLGLKQLRQLETEKELQRARDKLQIQNEELSTSEEELRAQNEELLLSREQIEILSRFPAENPNPVLRITADGRLLYSNGSARRLMSPSQGWREGGSVPSFWRKLAAEAFARGTSNTLDARMDKKVFSFAVVPVLDKDYVNIYATDITERKQMEDELQRAKQEWERTFDSVPDLIAILDPQHRIIRANRQMARRLGLEPEECVGLLCHECVHNLPAAPELCPHQQTLRDGREHIAEVYEQRLGGHFLVSTTPLCDEHGAITGTVHVARDITERKQIEEELRKSHDELEVRVQERTADLAQAVARLELTNQELQEFAFVASHDLQEPLRKIQSFCDLIVRSNHDKLNEKGKDYLARMQEAAKRMRQLLKDLLNYSRVASQPLPFKPADMKAIITEAAEVFEHRIANVGGKIVISEMPVIEADSSQMNRLFLNLISNAVKYAGPEKLLIRIYSGKDDFFCRIYVEDNGIGFEEKYLDRIFSPFQRLHGRTEFYGTGIGLAICRKIVERHAGSITARSSPGKGSTFVVTLPLKQKQRPVKENRQS
ncbi:MAG: PocR ligand-binding domain-containing protein [Syntrophobacteraceae bacterium]